jgi:hypothetical protein
MAAQYVTTLGLGDAPASDRYARRRKKRDYFRRSNLRLPLFLWLVLALLLLQDYCRHNSASFTWYWCFLRKAGGSVDSSRTAIGFSSNVLGKYCYKA